MWQVAEVKKYLATYFKSFQDTVKKSKSEKWFGDEWISQLSIYPSKADPKSVVFKLYKPHWSNGFKSEAKSSSQIFFSVWTDEKKANLLRYNIHALKLRQLRGYSLESRKFADAFRQSFLPMAKAWPNLSLDYGPQTLMEGFKESTPEHCEEFILELCLKFQNVAVLIEELLKRAKR